MRNLLLTLCLFAATLGLAPLSPTIYAQSSSAIQADSDNSSLAMPETTVADANGTPVISTRLIASHSSAKAGQTITLAWEFNLSSHWHIYWKNAGDSGLPPELTAEQGSLGPLSFPTPQLISIPPLTNYGYQNTVTLTIPYTVPDNLAAGEHTFAFSGNFLYCNDICMPGTVKLELPLVVAAASVENTAFAPPANLPVPLPEGATASISDKTIALNLPMGFATGKEPRFIPSEDGIINDSAKQFFNNDTLTIERDAQSKTKVDGLNGVLLLGPQGYSVDIPFTAPVTPEAKPSSNQTSITTVLLFAFLAGLILNLMPCVLPVLSLKVLSLVKFHHNRKDRAHHALAYSLGVISCFWVFAVLVAALAATGTQFGWGFHLQNPLFVALLTGLMLTLALQFFGVFELGHTLTRLGALGQKNEKTWASFATGVLAVLVATPCTVPFMGTAMAYALTQPFLPSLTVFTVLGTGMATPFLLTAIMPSALSWLPKPGAWMATFRHALGWPMLATALWLLYVFAHQTSVWATFVLLAGLLVLSFALWLYGAAPRGWKALLIFLVGMGSLLWLYTSLQQSASSAWQPWSPEAVTSHNEEQPVFVDFTADWCITCKVIEATVLNTTQVQDLFKKHNVLLLKADWTKQNPEITEELARNGRKGVPLYLLYRKGSSQAEILPQILTPSILEEALSR